MKSIYNDVFSLTRAALFGEKVNISEDTNPDELYKILINSKLAPIVYNTVAKSDFSEFFSPVLLERWKKNSIKTAVKQMFMNSELMKIVEGGEKKGLTLILFKGVAVASLYPDPNVRSSCDADILVYPEQQKEAFAFFKDLGYESIKEGSKEHVPVFGKTVGALGMKIELHDCLWEDYSGKQAKVLESLNLSSKSSLIKQSFHGMEYTTLGITEHLVFQLFHIVKHLFFEGISLRYFTDISLFVNKYYDEINWAKVREDMESLHYERFLDCIVCICQKYLGMREGVPGIKPIPEEMIEHLIEDVLGEKEPVLGKDYYETINFLETYFMRETAVKESKFRQKRKQFLPFPSELHERYSYAKKCPVLLPIAWVHRVVYFIGYKRDCKKYGKDANAAIKRSESRLDLMRELNLMDTDKDTKK